MPEYVIDAKVLISFLIAGKASYKSILRSYRFHAPEFILAEIKQYEPVIFSKTKLSETQLRNYTLDVFREITILPDYFIETENLLKAIQLLEKIDPKDAHYLALSLQSGFVLLTRDKPLHRGLRKLGYRDVVLFEDFLKEI
jgi:predicted nucleic acid-binding protein